MKNSRVCLVSTVRKPGSSFESFLRYHLAMGFERIFIFFDDPKDPALAIAKSIKGVTAIPCDAKYCLKFKGLKNYNELKSTIKTEVQTRQMLNATVAMKLALGEKFDWIFHIDADELIFNQSKCSIGKLMAQVPDYVEQVICLTREAIPQAMEIENPFIEVTYFKKNPTYWQLSRGQIKIYQKYFQNAGRMYFFAHQVGKAAARVRPNIFPRVHNFVKEDPKQGLHIFGKTAEKNPLESVNIEELILYHYPNCGFEQYFTKYKLLGDFTDKAYNNVRRLDFHKMSRDASVSGDIPALMALYRNHVQLSDPIAIRDLLKAGIIEKNVSISRRIKKLVSKTGHLK